MLSFQYNKEYSMASIKELLNCSFKGQAANDPALENEWEEVVKPKIDAHQQEEKQAIAHSDAYRAKFTRRDYSQPNGRPYHMLPSVMHIVDKQAPARR